MLAGGFRELYPSDRLNEIEKKRGIESKEVGVQRKWNLHWGEGKTQLLLT